MPYVTGKYPNLPSKPSIHTGHSSSVKNEVISNIIMLYEIATLIINNYALIKSSLRRIHVW